MKNFECSIHRLLTKLGPWQQLEMFLERVFSRVGQSQKMDDGICRVGGSLVVSISTSEAKTTEGSKRDEEFQEPLKKSVWKVNQR
jgi:hypothetical protein